MRACYTNVNIGLDYIYIFVFFYLVWESFYNKYFLHEIIFKLFGKIESVFYHKTILKGVEVEEMSINYKKYPLSFIAGVFAIGVFWIFTLISWAFFPGEYNPYDNWVSNLGNQALNPEGAIFFNIGCIITGILFFPFFFGLFEFYIGDSKNKILTVLTQIAGFVSAFSMIMIGIYPENNVEMHTFWTVIFFASTIPILFLPSIALYKYSFTRKLAKYGFAATALNLLLCLLFLPILEWLTIIVAFGFIGLMVMNLNNRIDKYRFIRKNMKPKKRNKGTRVRKIST